MSRLEVIQRPNENSLSKEKIDKLIRLIKYGHKANRIKEYQKRKRNFSESNRRKMIKTSAKKKEVLDSNDLYSHHQYKPISAEFFERSLSSPASAPNEVCDYNSDDAIIKKNQDNEMDIDTCQ